MCVCVCMFLLKNSGYELATFRCLMGSDVIHSFAQKALNQAPCFSHADVLFQSLFKGLYVFVVYFILHNQLCCPVKASYTVDMNGHTTPGSAFFTHGSGLPAAGGEISKSTQNLISAMEEVRVLCCAL